MKKSYRIIALNLFLMSILYGNAIFAQSFQWVNYASSSSSGEHLGVDGIGNIYVMGGGGTPIDFNGVILNGSGMFLAKYTSGGSIIWAVRIRGSEDMTVDNAGNMYTAGNPHDTIFAKYGSNGSLLWVKTILIEYGNQYVKAICIDNEKNIYVEGTFNGSFTAGTDVLLDAGTNTPFISKCDSNGNFIWTKKVVLTGEPECVGICTDIHRNIYITGQFMSPVNFGCATLTSSGSNDMFITKLNSDGVCQWARKIGTSNLDNSRAICTDLNCNVFVTGYSNGFNYILAKYDSLGTQSWVRTASGAEAGIGHSVCVDNLGNAYTVGSFNSTTVFGTISLTSSGSNDVFVAKYDANGNVDWAIKGGGSTYDQGYGVSIDNNGSLILAGTYVSNPANFGGMTIPNTNGNDDMFITKVALLTSNNEIMPEINISVFPNPANDNLTIRSSEKANVDIYTLQGQLVKSTQSKEEETTINLTNLSKGVYLIKVITEKGIMVNKLVKE